MAKTRNYEMDMTSGPIMGKLMMFTFPIILTSVLQLLFNAADTVVVGQFAGNEALAAVGSVQPVIGLLINVFNGLSMGAGVIVARYYGSGVQKDISNAVHTSIAMALVCGLACMVVGELFVHQLLVAVGIPENVMPHAQIYTRIYFAGVPFLVLYNFSAAILRSVGDTRRPLMYLTLAGVINVLLNLFTVIVLKLGVAGVAIATTVSQGVSMFLVMRCLILYDGAVRFQFRKLALVPQVCREIARIGLPAGLQGTIFSISNVMIQSGINSFGAVTMAANTAAGNVEGFLFVCTNSVYQSAMTFASQNVGARRYERITPIMKRSVLLVTVIGLIVGVGAYLLRIPLMHIYSSDPDVVSQGLIRFGTNMLPYFIYGIQDTFAGLLRGIGYSMLPMITSIACICGVRLFVVLAVFPMEQFHSLLTLYASYPISWVLALAANMACYFVFKRRLDVDVGLRPAREKRAE